MKLSQELIQKNMIMILYFSYRPDLTVLLLSMLASDVFVRESFLILNVMIKLPISLLKMLMAMPITI
jgi:hypothetical protein